MDDMSIREEAADTFWAPGTVRLEHSQYLEPNAMYIIC
jgi:hypothetical protein